MTQPFRSAVADVAYRLKQAGFEEPELNARLIVLHALKWSQNDAFKHRGRLVGEPELQIVERLVNRRLSHEPLQYILDKAHFYGREFKCDRRALIPRPESELIVEQVLNHNLTDEPCLLDVGTGSGVMAITLKLELPTAIVVATDDDPQALCLANVNAGVLNAQIEFIHADLYTGGMAFDVVVANLPYIPSGRFGALQKELAYEPRHALDGGRDGLQVLRRFWAMVPKVLKADGGLVVAEIDTEHADQALELAQTALPMATTTILDDLTGHARYVRAVL